MDQLKRDLFEYIKMQGFSIFLLIVFSYYFYIEVGNLQTQIRDCEKAYRNTLMELIDSRNNQYKSDKRILRLEESND